MDELALRRGGCRPRPEDADAVADARPAELGDRQADLDILPGNASGAKNEQRVSATSAIGSPEWMSSRPCSTSQPFTALSNHW